MKVTPPNKQHGQSVNSIPQEFSDRYYDKQEVLQKFNISSRTLQDWRDNNIISYTRLGKKFYYLKESLDKLIADRMVLAKTNNLDEALRKSPFPEKQNDITADIFTTQPSDIQQSTSFAKVWDPIPGYMVPVLTMLIYFTPYINDIIKGSITDPFYFLLPLMVGGVGCAAYLLLQIGIAISKRIIANRKNS